MCGGDEAISKLKDAGATHGVVVVVWWWCCVCGGGG